MGRPRSRIPIVSRVMTAHETAAYIGVGDSKFGQMRKIGAFPVKPLPYGPYWDQRAVDRWFDVQAGLTLARPRMAQKKMRTPGSRRHKSGPGKDSIPC